MKEIEKMSKKELLKLPVRGWDDDSRLYDQILIVPAGTKHDSGYMHIAIVGVWKDGNEKKAELCAFPDDISYFFPKIEGLHFDTALVRQDCYYPSGVLRFHTRNGKFYVSEALSSVDIKLVPNPLPDITKS